MFLFQRATSSHADINRWIQAFLIDVLRTIKHTWLTLTLQEQHFMRENITFVNTAMPYYYVQATAPGPNISVPT
jgi:hypothetical protein